MRLSKASYFADFAIYPPVVVMLLFLALWQAALMVLIEWFIFCLAGIAAWTLLEYIIHRGVLHRIEFFAAMHRLTSQGPRGVRGHANMVESSGNLCRRAVSVVVGDRLRFR
jgi:hypothetical protein